MTDVPALTVRDLPDSCVAITGGTSGVGLAAARQFAAAGVRRLALLGRNEERGRHAAASVRAEFGETQVDYVQVDASEVADAERAANQARAILGRIDVLVNTTTSSNVPNLLQDIPAGDIAGILTEQALPPLHMTRIVLPWMCAQRGGAIVNVASDAAKLATPGESVIGAAMAAILMFSRTAAIEAKRDGVRVNALTPSLISGTPTTDRVLEGGFSAKLFQKAAKLADLGVATPDDVAALIVFLAGPAAARLTGQAISVNGGISAA